MCFLQKKTINLELRLSDALVPVNQHPDTLQDDLKRKIAHEKMVCLAESSRLSFKRLGILGNIVLKDAAEQEVVGVSGSRGLWESLTCQTAARCAARWSRARPSCRPPRICSAGRTRTGRCPPPPGSAADRRTPSLSGTGAERASASALTCPLVVRCWMDISLGRGAFSRISLWAPGCDSSHRMCSYFRLFQSTASHRINSPACEPLAKRRSEEQEEENK